MTKHLMGSGNANKAIAEDLGAYPDALTLTVTPDGDAASDQHWQRMRTIALTYTDADGETQIAIVLTFCGYRENDCPDDDVFLQDATI